MYKIEKKGYGVNLTFSGSISQEEMAKWVAESDKVSKTLSPKFSVFVDMRDLKPLSPEAQNEMQKGQKLFKMRGMERSVVIVNTNLVKMQFKRIAQETGIYQWERYIDSSSVKDWEKIGVDWLTKGIDPDKE